MRMRLKRVKRSDKIAYYYFPEGSKIPGLVEVDTNTGEVNLVRISSHEKKNGFNNFVSKARGAVKKMLDDGELLDEKYFAWG